MAVDSALASTPSDGRGLTLAPPHSTHANRMVLLANIAARTQVPDGARYVIYQPSGPMRLYVRVNADPAEVTGSIADGTAGELNPEAREVNPGDWLHLRSDRNGEVTLAYWR